MADYMSKMSAKTECVRHLAFVAAPEASAAQISDACDRMNERFTVGAARELCMGLNDVHASFWARFY